MQHISHTHNLNCGMPCVHVTTAGSASWLGVAVDAGSRDERRGEFGLAHFVEHAIFKGTRRRSATFINSRMERVGGELNAYTTKESTMVYTVSPPGNTERAMELVADLVRNTAFPPDELERELDVVLEELASARDVPADAVYDDFEEMLFAGSQLGHCVLGREADLRKLSREHCLQWLNSFFVPQRMVLFSAGPEKPEKVFRAAEKHFAAFAGTPDTRQRKQPEKCDEKHHIAECGLHQAHTVAGARVGGIYDDDRFAMALLANLLGGPGMNSLLNVELREKRGLVYSVDASVVPYTDCGALLIYLGCERDKLPRALKLIKNTIHRLADTPLTPRRLEACKKQYCGQLLVASDSTEGEVFNAARGMLYHGSVSQLSDTIECFMETTAEQIQKAAQEIVNLSTLTMV